MENEIKLNLNIKLPGSLMFSEQLCSENSELYENNRLVVTDKKNKKYSYNIKTRGSVPATQSINISRAAYNYFIGKENPYFINNKKWLQMSKKERLKAHLDDICSALNGISYTFQVFDD